VDLARFDAAVAAARAARSSPSPGVAIRALDAVLAAYGGELLPEDGPAEWVAARRDRTRAEVVEAARLLAELLLERDPDGAADACAAGLAVDPYHDPLWRLLVQARERAGDAAAATSARTGYARMLDELGVATGDRA
jgi:DNA-binding SARP family transcriptional activator